jgi:hypothetical protein
MQIFELTQKRKLNEYDPSRSPPGTPNYATGVGPGVKPQMTVTPTVSGSPTVAPATSATPNFATGVGPGVKSQMTATPTVSGASTVAPAPAPAPALATPNFATGVGPGVKSQMTATPTAQGSSAVTPAPAPAPAPVSSQPTYNVPLAKVPATNTAMPSNMSTTGTPVASPTSGVDPALAAASKVNMTGPQGRKANIGGAIANAMQAYNANKVGLGYLLPKDAKEEVYTDSTGKITIDDVPYDATNPEHQRIVGTITIGGKPYNGANPEHRAAYLAFKNTAGRGGSDTVKIDANGQVTVLGQPFDPGNPAHVQAYRQHVLGSSVVQTPPPATPQQPPPAAQQPPATATGSSDVKDALLGLGYTAQQAAALAAKVPPGTSTEDALRQILQRKITESLTWSRKFDPSATLLKKMKSQ